MGSKRTAAAAVGGPSRPPLLKASTFANTVLIYSSTTYLNAIFDGGDDKSYTMIWNKDHDISKEEILRIASNGAATISNSASSTY